MFNGLAFDDPHLAELAESRIELLVVTRNVRIDIHLQRVAFTAPREPESMPDDGDEQQRSADEYPVLNIHRRPSCATLTPANSGHLGRLLYIDRYQARYARFAHRHTHQVIGHLHRELVVRDDDELYALGHFANQARKTHDVGIVERCIDFVEQTYRARIQLKYREDQRDRRQRFFTAGEQVNARVALARRPGHQRHAGIEQVFTGQFEIGVTAAEDLREQGAEALR